MWNEFAGVSLFVASQGVKVTIRAWCGVETRRLWTVALPIIVLCLVVGCSSGSRAEPEPSPPAPDLSLAGPVDWVQGAPDDQIFLTVEDLNWWDDLREHDRGSRAMYDFCETVLPGDHLLTLERGRLTVSGDDPGGLIGIDQWFQQYRVPYAAAAVDEIRGMALSCDDYEIEGVGYDYGFSFAFESCGEFEFDTDIPDASLFGYCEIGFDPKGEYYRIHTFIGVDEWMITMKVSMWDRTDAERFATNLTAEFADRFHEALRSE